MLTCPFFLECDPFRSSWQKNGKRSFPFLLSQIGSRSFPVPFQFPKLSKIQILSPGTSLQVLSYFPKSLIIWLEYNVIQIQFGVESAPIYGIFEMQSLMPVK